MDCGISHLACWRAAARLTGLLAVFASLLIFQPAARAAQNSAANPSSRQEVIARLAGDDVAVTGAVSFENKNGRTTALLASGSDLTLRSGQAKVDLEGGGDVILCGPAHLSIVKSGSAVTIALDYGQVHLQVGATAQITIFTPLLVVTPAAIGDRQRDVTVGLDDKGLLCVMALSGAMRVQEQFTAESVIIPQGGDVEIESGELRTLRTGSRKCSCDLLVSQSDTKNQIELSAAARPPANPAPPRPADPANEPVYRIDIPLTFNASAPPSPAGPSPEAIAIIRESVSNTSASFRGAVRPALPVPPPQVSVSSASSHPSKLHFFAKLFSIFHHHRETSPQQSAAARP